jgi:surface antigen
MLEIKRYIKKSFKFTIIGTALILTGCSQNSAEMAFNNPEPSLFYGGVIGTGSGAFPTTPYADGSMSGELIGLFHEDDIDKTLDAVNRLKIANILEFKPSNEWQTWTDRANNIKYSIRPGRPMFSSDGSETCRDYDLVSQQKNRSLQASGLACRRVDGNWILNS